MIRSRDTYLRWLVGAVVIGLALFLIGFIFSPVRIARFVPYHLHSLLVADYSADVRLAKIPQVKLDVILDMARDAGTPIASEQMATIQAILQAPIPSITPLSTLLSAPTSTFVIPRSTPTQFMPAASSTAEVSPSASLTPTQTESATVTSTQAATTTPVFNPTKTSIFTPIGTLASPTSTRSPSATPTQSVATVTQTKIAQPTATKTPTPSLAPTLIATTQPSSTATSTYTRVAPTPTPTRTPTPLPPTPTQMPYPIPPTIPYP